MPTTPAVRASTTKRARKAEVFDKMTTVRGVSSSPDALIRAIAEAVQAGGEGAAGLDRISNKMQAQEKARHAKDMKQRK